MKLCLVRLRPDMDAFSRWAATRGFLPAGADAGYAWHAALKSVLGDLAPKPFAVRAGQAYELLGYSTGGAEAFRLAREIPPLDDRLATTIGLPALEARDLPDTWTTGAHLSFEVRCRPVVRVKRDDAECRPAEIDVAAHRFLRDPEISRTQAYLDWLHERIVDLGGARLESARVLSDSRSRVLRRPPEAGARRVALIEGPDITFRGQLCVTDSERFSQMIARGVGRHRAFGFGCLLLAPPGALA